MPVPGALQPIRTHLYLWVPNALLTEGLRVMEAWGFAHKTNIVLAKSTKGRGTRCDAGLAFTFGTPPNSCYLRLSRAKMLRTLEKGRTQVNVLKTRKREHSRKPDDEQHNLLACTAVGASPRTLLPAAAHPGGRFGANQSDDDDPTWDTYTNHSQNS